MARVTSVNQARKITSISHDTETLVEGLDQYKDKYAPNKSRFSVRIMYDSRHWDMNRMFDALTDEDKQEVDRYVLNKMKRRVKLNQEWLKKQGIRGS